MELEQQIRKNQVKAARLKKQRAEQLKVLEKSRQNETSILGTLEKLENSIRRKVASLKKISLKITQTKMEIRDTQKDIKRLKKQIKEDQIKVNQQVKLMFYLYKVKMLTLFPGYQNIKHHFRNQRIIKNNAQLDLDIISRLEEHKLEQSRKIVLLSEKSTELATLKVTREEQKEILDFEREQQVTYLQHITSNQKARYQYLREIQQSLEQLNDIIFSLQQKKRYSQRQRKLQGFKKQFAKLASPVTGKLVHGFKRSGNNEFYRLYRRGVLIETPDDQDVVTIMNGKVVFSAQFKGYQNLVVIDHGQRSFTIYGNLSEVYIQEGEYINQGDTIGRVVYNQQKEAFLFYFEMRYKKRAVNPTKWLKKPRWKKM